MFIKDNLRFNIQQKYTDPETGEHGIDMTVASNRARFGVTEISDPVRGDENLFYNQEINEFPYLTVTPKPPEIIEAARIAKLDQQILGLERQAIDQGLIRTIIDDLLIRSLTIAAQAGVTEAQLLDEASEHYSKAFAKVHSNAAARAVLRTQR